MKLATLLLVVWIPIAFGSSSTISGGGPNKNSVQIPGTKIWFSKTEVSVAEYNDFLKGLIDEGRTDEVSQHAVDDQVWVSSGVNNKFMLDNYSSAEAFRDYPVVGVKYESAMAFCEWLSRKMQAEGKNFQARLPTIEEWQLAAKSGIDNAVFAGGNIALKDDKDRYLFNFRPGETDWASDNYMLTAPVRPVTKQFAADSYGMFHLGGNVAEMTITEGISMGGSWNHGEESLRIEQKLTYNEPQAWLGFRYVLEVIDTAN